MALRKPRLNNMSLSYQRRELLYEAVMSDLVLMGAIPKEVCEKFTGVQFASGVLKAPEGFEVDGSAADTE